MHPIDFHHPVQAMIFHDPLQMVATDAMTRLPRHELGSVDVHWVTPEAGDAAGL